VPTTASTASTRSTSPGSGRSAASTSVSRSSTRTRRGRSRSPTTRATSLRGSGSASTSRSGSGRPDVARPVITFLSDFGPSAPAVCRGVMFGIAPDANVIDITHQVPRFSIRDGAASLVFALPHMPVGVHIAVVDPGVGTERLPLALKTGRGDLLVGPDNGLLIAAAEELGGIVEARSITNRALMLERISSSFHGRDIFSPTAAHLATGTPFEEVGPTVPLDSLVRLPEVRPTVRDGVLETAVVHVMVFGNVTLAGVPEELVAAVG